MILAEVFCILMDLSSIKTADNPVFTPQQEQKMTLNQDLMNAVRTLSDAGCHYRLDELAGCYEPDLQIFIVQPDGNVLSFDYEQNMAFFRERRDAGAPPINTSIHFNIAEVQGGTGFVTATRRMDLGYGAGEQEIVFTLMLRIGDDGKWRVFREHAVITSGRG